MLYTIAFKDDIARLNNGDKFITTSSEFSDRRIVFQDKESAELNELGFKEAGNAVEVIGVLASWETDVLKPSGDIFDALVTDGIFFTKPGFLLFPCLTVRLSS